MPMLGQWPSKTAPYGKVPESERRLADGEKQISLKPVPLSREVATRSKACLTA